MVCIPVPFSVATYPKKRPNSRNPANSSGAFSNFDSGGQLRYIGGYYNRRAAIHPLNEEICFALEAGEPLKSLPLFDWAVRDRLQAAVDPLGLI
jgi:hypothetical protein